MMRRNPAAALSLSLSLSLALWMILGISTSPAPLVHAEVMLPTITDCEAVEDAMNDGAWGNHTIEERNSFSETGWACMDTYPALYPTGGTEGAGGQTCNTYGVSPYAIHSACAWAIAQTFPRPDSACDGDPPTANSRCYLMQEQGRGSSGIGYTSGDVLESGHAILRCDWDTDEPAECQTTIHSELHWDEPGNPCLFVSSTTTVNVHLDGLTIPNGVANDHGQADCA